MIEEDEIKPRTYKETRELYEYFDQNGILLIGEINGGGAIGEVWLNREKIPGEDAYRAPILIGEKKLWGKGFGTDVLRTVLDYCFINLKNKYFYAFDVNSDNFRALRMYIRCGFIPYEVQNKGNRWERYQLINFKVSSDRYLSLRGHLMELEY